MKNTVFILASCLCMTPAFSQSSITLYGIIDSGLTYASNEGGSHNIREDDGIYYGNRWGLKGTEDLGGGLSAIFQLENGFSLGTGKLGQFGAEFGRQAYAVCTTVLSWGAQLPSNSAQSTEYPPFTVQLMARSPLVSQLQPVVSSQAESGS